MSSKSTTLRRLTWVLWGLTAVMAVLVFSLRSYVTSRGPELPIVQEVPDFSLTNRDGSQVGLGDLAGKPWVADFVFTRCPGVCPVMTRRMQELIADLPEGSARYVSVSVDPTYDTPAVLEAYAQKHDAGPDWYFLTGSEEVIYPLIREGFLLALDPEPEGGPQSEVEPIVHSNRFVLVDAEGKIRGYYNSYNAEELTKLRTDLARLAGVSVGDA